VTVPWTDESLAAHVKAWRDCTMPLEVWAPHESHLATTVWHLRHHPFPEALRLMREGIQRYNASVGRSAGYHETVTVVYVHLIADVFRRLDRGQGVAELAQAVIDEMGVKPEQRRALFRMYYSDPDVLLKTEQSRRTFIPPDLKPLPPGAGAV
jgi:hypothetical protein